MFLGFLGFRVEGPLLGLGVFMDAYGSGLRALRVLGFATLLTGPGFPVLWSWGRGVFFMCCRCLIG